MNDLEGDVREILNSKAREASISDEPTRAVVARARRRQLGTVITATLAAALLVAGSLIGLRSLLGADPANQRPATPPVLPDAPDGFRPVALPQLSLAYPDDWSLVALQPDRTRERLLQLANFELGPGSGACEQGWSLPQAGVLLEVRLGALQDPLPSWPTPLGVEPGAARPCGADRRLAASWEANGTAYSATGLFAADAVQADVDLLERAFETLTFPKAVPQTEELLGISNLVLESADSPVGPVVLYAFADLEEVVRERPSYWIGIAGPIGSGLSGASSIGRDVPIADESVTMTLDTWGGVVWGDVSSEAVRAELRTVEGLTFPADLLPLAQSIGLPSHQAVWGIIQGATADRVTTLLYNGQGTALNTYFPAGSRVPIATGTDPEGGPWELYLEPTNEGTGLGFGFTHHGGGGGCCLRPLKGDFRLDGWGSGGDEPSDITALGSEAVTRLEFEAASGERIEGALYAVPDASLGIPQVGLVIVPSSVALEGQLVAYGASGDELAREDVGDNPEPAGPTTEIDVVWDRLRRARDVVQEYEARHQGSLSGFDATEARKIDPGIGGAPGIRWNDGSLASGDVSIRGVARAGGSELTGLSGWTVALVSATVGPNGSVGAVYCIAVNIDENGGGNFRYGTQDAANYEECRGGWPELGR
jgi:hypothetical protein